MVDIYNEPFVNVSTTISQWFGTPTNPVIADISILFSYLFLFVFALSLFGLLFKRWR